MASARRGSIYLIAVLGMKFSRAQISGSRGGVVSLAMMVTRFPSGWTTNPAMNGSAGLVARPSREAMPVL